MATTKKAPAKKASAKKASPAVPFTKVIQSISNKADVPATDVGKAVRAHIRRHRDDLVKDGWKGLSNHEHGNRYPDMPAEFAATFIAGRVATMSKSS